MRPVIRPPAVAGTFYPAEPARLRSMVRRDLDAVTTAGEVPVAIIVPHAGYVYSGPVAASAYALLRSARDRIRLVVLLGPSHRIAVRGVAASSATHFETPLGRVAVDRAAMAAALELPLVRIIDAAHAREHSLEVQLPFLQCVLGDFRILPLVVGEADGEEVARVVAGAWRGDDRLLVVSSDLSHYHRYEVARALDAATARAIAALDADALDPGSACGRVPIQGLLIVARRRGLVARVLDLRSSGDTAGSRDEVVGYGAWAFERAPAPDAGPGSLL